MAWGRLLVLLAVGAVVAVSAEDVSFRGHTVLRAVPLSEEQVQAMHAFLLEHPELDVWAETRLPGAPIDVRVNPSEQKLLQKALDGLGIKSEVFIQDVHMMVAHQARQISLRKRANPGMGWTSYYRLDEINKWMDAIAENNPEIVTRIEAGQSYENRTIRGLAISFKPGNNPIVFVEAGIHAREWITPAAATYFINEILSTKNETVRNYDWHIFPSVNPDGYEYTHTTDRMWRKTRSPQYYFFSGVDANRNWPFHWNEAGASSLPFAETYAGPRAASEPETQGLKKYLDSVASRTKAYICLHSYSQLLMFPYSYTKKLTPRNEDLLAVGKAGADYMSRVFGTKYTVGPIASTIYEAAGSTVDYAYSKNITYSYAFELRDTGRYGFLLPPDQILPTVQETYGAVVTMLKEIEKRG